MIAPTTQAVAEILKAVNRYGREAGSRSFQRIWSVLEAYERVSSSARGSTDVRPRRVLIATGKNVRNAAMIETENQSGKPLPPNQMTTIGATARIGIVWEATMYGRKPRWSRREWARTTPSTNPIEAPSTNPTAASFAVNSDASQSTSISSGPFRREGSKSWPTMSWRWGKVLSLTSKLRSSGCRVAEPLEPSHRA
jgi:hypothetical protein